MKFTSLFCAAFMLLVNSFIGAAPLPTAQVLCSSSLMHIEAYETSSHQTTILLNNGTLWTYKDTDLFSGPKGWKLGDCVHIVYSYFQGYHLKNVSYRGCVPVKLTNLNSENIKAVRIQSIVKNPLKSTYTIVLDDQTKWFIGSWSGAWMTNWQVGDRMLVTPQDFMFGDADYLLINLDREEGSHLPVNVRAQLMHSRDSLCLTDVNKREAGSWNVYISNVWEQNKTQMIELDNKTVWQCSISKKPWQIGDEVIFAFDEENLKLKNLHNKEKIKASLVNGPSAAIQSFFIHDISHGKNKVILDDQSIWLLGNEPTKDWKNGDRIIVASQGFLSADTTTHFLINLDRLHRKFAVPSYCAVTLVH